ERAGQLRAEQRLVGRDKAGEALSGAGGEEQYQHRDGDGNQPDEHEDGPIDAAGGSEISPHVLARGARTGTGVSPATAKRSAVWRRQSRPACSIDAVSVVRFVSRWAATPWRTRTVAAVTPSIDSSCRRSAVSSGPRSS